VGQESAIVSDRELNATVVAATLTAMGMIAFQIAAKATRDALFLSSFPVSSLPLMVMAAAIVSVLAAFAVTRLMTSRGPARVIPLAFALSAVIALVEWSFVDGARRAVAVAVYLHFSALGAVLISGFWSVMNERFDPRTAKRHIGRIAVGGTIGGLIGGLLAERVAVWLSVTAMLPILAGLHFACAWLILRVRGPEIGATARRDVRPAESGLKTITRMSYLRALVALVVLTSVSEGLIDYVFKARAAETFGSGESLLRLFAAFYTAIALVTVVVQAVGSRLSLERLGLARTVGVLPSSVVLGGAAALLVPGFTMVMVARGAESICRNGLYRAGYELLFAPLAPRQKRATKTLIDVGVVRAADVIGAGIVQAALMLTIVVVPFLWGVAIALSLAAAILAFGLQRGYVKALERSLLSRAGQLNLDEARDDATRTAMLQSAGAIGFTLLDHSEMTGVESPAGRPQADYTTSAPVAIEADREIERLVALRSRDAVQVRRVLAEPDLSGGIVAYAIPLLAWDEVARDVIAALRRCATTHVGLLIDRLVDPDESFAVRRRIPLILAACPVPRTVEGLLAGLQDTRFEVRYRSGRALARLVEKNPELRVDRAQATAAVLREVAVDRGVWESYRLIDRQDDDDWSPVMDEMLRDRANRALEHLFTVLALILPRQPLKVAFRGLHTDDAHLRGTALEYLETALPDDLRKAVWPFLEDSRRPRGERRSAEDVLKQLLESNHSIAINLQELRKREPPRNA